MLRPETDAGRNLPRFEKVVAVEVENGFVPRESVAQGDVHVARSGQVVDALNGFAVYKSGKGQLPIGTGGERKSIVHLDDAITLLPVERNVPEVAVLLAMPQADEGQAGIQPVLYAEWYRRLYACLLLVIEIEFLIDFHQTFGGLVEGLHGVVFGMIEPGAENVFSLQNIGHLKLIVLRGLQQRIAMHFGISATDVRDGILHRPIDRILLVAAQGELEDMSRGGRAVQVDVGIPVPPVPDGSLVMLCRQRGVQREAVAEALAETGIEVPGLLAAAGLHVGQGIRSGERFAGFGVVIVLVAVVDAGGIDGSVVQSPAALQGMFLSQKELPTVDALAIFGIEVECLLLHLAVQQLAGRRAVVGQLRTCLQTEWSAVVQAAVVQPVGAAAEGRGELRACNGHPVVVGGISAVIDQTQPMLFGDVIVRPEPEVMDMAPSTAHLVSGQRIDRTIGQGVPGLFSGCGVAATVRVRVKEICREFILMIKQAGAFLKAFAMLLAVFGIKLPLPGGRAACRLLQDDVNQGAAHLVAGGSVVHHFRLLDASGRDAPQQLFQLFGGEGGDLSVQYHGDALTCQLQPAVRLDNTGKLFHSLINIVHGKVLHQTGQVIHQLALRGFHEGTFAGNHHFRQGAVKAVETGIGRNQAVGTEGTGVAGIGRNAVVLLRKKCAAA